MCRQRLRVAGTLVIHLLLTLPGVSQVSSSQPSPNATNNSAQPVPTFHASTRMVTLEVVVKDHHGRHATGLKASDFQVFEQSLVGEKEKREQRIAAFREVNIAELASQTRSEMQVPPDVYTNLVSLQKNPVPPTILLVDGLNTEVQFQAQIHVQMLRILKSLPRNVPVAVFLFGHRLRMLQDFTSDPSLLQSALDKAISVAGAGIATIDPRDDPDAPASQVDRLGGPSGKFPDPTLVDLIAAAREFDQEVYAANMDMRVRETGGALVALARHLAGYPGRKNLLWISTAFPIYLGPLRPEDLKSLGTASTLPQPTDDVGRRNYWTQIQKIAAALSEAKVSVYPINPAGVQPPTLFEAGSRPRDLSPEGTMDSLSRETLTRANADATMEALAEGTGGIVCTGNNDLGDCIRRAVDDGSSFYEIAYYPDSQNWNGEYRKIILKATRPGLHLAYRLGYFAQPEESDKARSAKDELPRAACHGYLNATSIFFAATKLPSDSSEALKFYLAVEPSGLTFAPTTEGKRELNINVAVCTFDKNHNPVQLLVEPLRRELTMTEYQSLAASGLPHYISIPGPKPAALRLLVMDIPSGRMGSVDVKLDEGVGKAATPAAENVAKPPGAH